MLLTLCSLRLSAGLSCQASWLALVYSGSLDTCSCVCLRGFTEFHTFSSSSCTRLRFPRALCIWQSLVGVVRLRSTGSPIYLGDDFQICFRIQHFLVRHRIHVYASPRGSLDEFHTFFHVFQEVPQLQFIVQVVVSSVIAQRQIPVRAVRSWKSAHIPVPCLWQSLRCPRSTGVLDYFWEMTSWLRPCIWQSLVCLSCPWCLARQWTHFLRQSTVTFGRDASGKC